jgi:hypothetical protein
VVRTALGGRLLALSLGSSHERAPVPLFVLLLIVRAVGGAFASILVLLRLTSGAVKNRPSCDIKELLGGPRALVS